MRENYLYRRLSSRYYGHDVPILALDYYDPHSQGEDDFSRRQIWFYNYGDEDIHQDFRLSLSELFETYFGEDKTDWDLMTLYPVHAADKINPHMRELVLDVSGDNEMNFEQVLRRSKTIKESHELDTMKSKLINLDGSLEVTRNVEDRDIVLVDNIVLTGASLLHGANRLKQAGAGKVFGVCLGTSMDYRDDTREVDDSTATELLEEGENI